MAEALDIEPIKSAAWQKIADLRSLLEKNDPTIAGHCKAIHKELITYDELVHLLSDDQIRQIVVAQKSVTGTMLVQKVTKTSAASLTKQAKAIKADDL